jgi:hypothetical protein
MDGCTEGNGRMNWKKSHLGEANASVEVSMHHRDVCSGIMRVEC